MVAEHICGLVRSKPTAALGLATGRSPVQTYNSIIQMADRNGISFGSIRAFMLDEYLGISDDNPGRYRNVLQEFISGVGIDDKNVFALPNNWPSGPEPDRKLNEICRQFEDDISSVGGIDLQLLGISRHGHIAFNEPMSSLASRTRVKTLTSYSRDANAYAFADISHSGDDIASFGLDVLGGPDDVPTHAVTQGVGTILESHHAILIAIGPEKAEIVARAVEGPVTSFVPASALQMHRHATVILDAEAAGRLEMKDYYHHIQENKRYIQLPIT